MNLSSKDRERFIRYVHENPNGCWDWSGRVRSGGRGYFSLYDADHPKGRHVRASRVAWVLAHGSIPDGLCVCHQCDRPICVNPAHLFLGTQTDNLKDMRAKGRGFDGTANLRIHKATAIANLPRGVAWRAARGLP